MKSRTRKRVERAVWSAVSYLVGALVLGGMFWGYVIWLVFNGGQWS